MTGVFAILATAQPLLNEEYQIVLVTAAALALGALFAGVARRVMGVVGLLACIVVVIIVVTNGLNVTSYGGGLIQWNGFRTATDTQDLPFFLTGCIGVLGLLALSVRDIVTGKLR